ncbi:MAG: hypothetical protein P1P84_12345 [Deferrisomatales bacterium]|nr:hypothetical protein [Deferrisomatales bacterium]
MNAELTPVPVPDWPKLAWVARLSAGEKSAEVFHGPCVEANARWCVEAVWDGPYEKGGFDRSDLVFGSGVRCRGGDIIFVSPGSTLDRLWYHHLGDTWHVGNTLPGLLSVADVSLCKEGVAYSRLMDSITRGVIGYERAVPCSRGDLGVVYFNNLFWNGHRLEEIDKPDTAPRFDTFDTYVRYLEESADGLSANLGAAQRSHRVSSLVTVSQGYDSSLAAVVAKRMGCRHSVTIGQSSSFWRGSDSGEEVARYLGLECATFPRKARCYPYEESVWAVSGRAGILNWALFDYPEPLSLFLTGPYGDKMWGRTPWEYSDPFEFTGLSLGGIGEFRLYRGVFHCPLPFWGMRHLRELWEITASQPMQSWSIPGDYDRPIPRRIVEEAGVPRGAFGQRKKNTSHDEALLWPYGNEAAESYRRFLRDRGLPVPGGAAVWLQRRLAAAALLVEANLPRGFIGTVRRRRKEAMSGAADQLFLWANEVLQKDYREAFRNAVSLPGDGPCLPGVDRSSHDQGDQAPGLLLR